MGPALKVAADGVRLRRGVWTTSVALTSVLDSTRSGTTSGATREALRSWNVCGPIAGRDRVLAIRRDRNRGRVLIPEENTPLGGGTSSRRAGTRALPELHLDKAGLEMLSGRIFPNEKPRVKTLGYSV